MSACAICGEEILNELPVLYEGDECHFECALMDLDAIGMDRDTE